MFRIFRNGHDKENVFPYLLGDGIPGILFAVLGVLAMLYLAAAAPAAMYLPVLSVLFGLTALLYLGGKEGHLRGRAAYYTAYPFLVYGWAGMNWAVFAVTVQQGSLLYGMIGWMVLALIGVFVLVFPSFEAAGSSLGGLVLLPLAALWASAVIYGVSDPLNGYYNTAARLAVYTFRVFAVLLLAALVIWLVMTVKDLIDSKDTRIRAVGGLVMFVLGLPPAVALPLLSTMIGRLPLAGIVLGYFFILALLSYRKSRHEPAPGAGFALLPLLAAWLCSAVHTWLAMGTAALLPLPVAGKGLGLFAGSIGTFLADRIGAPSLEAFRALLDILLGWISRALSGLPGVSLAPSGISDLSVIVCGFFLLLLVMWAGTLIRDKIK